MKAKHVFFVLISELFFFKTAYSTTNLRDLVRGSKGKTAFLTTLPADRQITFNSTQTKDVLGLDKNADMILLRAETDQIGEMHYRYNQTYNGIPIEDAIYIMHVKDGMLKRMGGEVVLDFSPQMSLPASAIKPELAIQSAMNYVSAQTYAWQVPDMEQQIKRQSADSNATLTPTAVLVWYSPGGKIDPANLHLAYKVDIYAKEPLSRAYYYLDAQTGLILGKKDELFYTDAVGIAYTGYSGPQTIHSDLNGTSYRLRDYSKGNGVVTLDAITHLDYTSTTQDWNLNGSLQYVLDAHYGVEQTYDFYKTNFNRNSVDNAGLMLTAYANQTSLSDNAYWDGYFMHFGVRSSNGNGVTAIDIAGHELTHGVTQYTSGLYYDGESGAINESMSDIMGKSVQFWSKPTDVNWHLSNDMNWIIRDLSNPNTEGQPDTYLGDYWYSGSSDNGGVHTNSGVGNFMFYLLVTGGSGINDIGNSYTVNGIGLAEADAIIYRSETVYLTPYSQYTNWRTACVNAATDLYGAASNEVVQVENAFYAVGIGTIVFPVCNGIPSPGTISPASSTVCSNSSLILILSGYTTGKSGMTFQWKSSPDNNTFTNIPQATLTGYTASGLTADMYYECVVSCSSGSSATSNTVKVTVSPNATLYNVTGGGAYCSGGSGVSVGLSSSEVGVNYQLKNGSSTVGSPVAGTNSVISFGNQTGAGIYSVVSTKVSSGCTRTMSGSATVTVNTSPTASVTANGSTDICSGNSVTLSANSGIGFSYQWKKNNVNILNAVSSTYKADTTGSFTCIVTNTCNSVTSNAINVTIVGAAPPSVITPAGKTHICSGSSAALNTNTGSGLTYQWQLNGVNIQGQVSSSYNATVAGDYTCVVTNGCGSKASNKITVTILGRNTLVLQPNGDLGIDAEVATNIPNTPLGHSGELNAITWTGSGMVASQRSFIKFDLTSIPPLAIVQQAILTLYNDPLSANAGGMHSSLIGSNAGWVQKVIAAWDENTITWNNQPFTTLTGEAAIPQSIDPHEDYSIDITNLVQDMIANPISNYGMMIRLQDETIYKALIFASSDNADSTNWPKLSIVYNTTLINANSTYICPNDSALLGVIFTDSSFKYKWQKDNGDIPLAESSFYYAKTAGSYQCIVTDSCGNSTSNAISLAMNTAPSKPDILPIGNDLCITGFETHYRFQWLLNGGSFGSNTSCATPDQNGSYMVIVTDTLTNCQSTSNPFLITGTPFNAVNTAFNIYPNPSSGAFIIEFYQKNSTVEIKILDLTGRTIRDEKQIVTGKYKLDIRDQPKGIYFLQLTSNGKTVFQKFIIQ